MTYIQRIRHKVHFFILAQRYLKLAKKNINPKNNAIASIKWWRLAFSCDYIILSNKFYNFVKINNFYFATLILIV